MFMAVDHVKPCAIPQVDRGDNLGEDLNGFQPVNITRVRTPFVHTLFHCLQFFNNSLFEPIQCHSIGGLNLSNRSYPLFGCPIRVSLTL